MLTYSAYAYVSYHRSVWSVSPFRLTAKLRAGHVFRWWGPIS